MLRFICAELRDETVDRERLHEDSAHNWFQRITSSYGERPNAVFGDVVGNLAVAVFQIVHQLSLLV